MRDANDTHRGFTLIELLIVTSILAILACVSLLILGQYPKRAANEAAAISSLRSLVTAEKIFWLTQDRDKYANFAELLEEQLIDTSLASGYRHGYNFVLATEGNHFTVTANPVSNREGTRSFFADESGVIRFKVGTGASAADSSIGG